MDLHFNMENGNWVTGNIVLRINGEPVEMEMTVPDFPVKPHRMLPVFPASFRFVGVGRAAIFPGSTMVVPFDGISVPPPFVEPDSGVFRGVGVLSGSPEVIKLPPLRGGLLLLVL